MTILVIILVICFIAAIPLGIKNSVAYKKAYISKKAKHLGYDLRFDK